MYFGSFFVCIRLNAQVAKRSQKQENFGQMDSQSHKYHLDTQINLQNEQPTKHSLLSLALKENHKPSIFLPKQSREIVHFLDTCSEYKYLSPLGCFLIWKVKIFPNYGTQNILVLILSYQFCTFPVLLLLFTFFL